MNRTIRILTLLAVMVITAGQAWADEPTYGKIHYTNGSTDGGTLTFYKDADCSAAITIDGTTHKSDVLNSTDLTDATVYIKAMPDFGYSGINVEFTAEESIGSGAAEAPRRHAPGVGQNVTVTAVEGKPGIYQFIMPSSGNNITITALFPVSTPINVDYLDATGAKKTAQAYVLDGAELFLGKSNQEVWYVCNSNVDYRTKLTLYGAVNLILADDKTMTITPSNGQAIYAENGVAIHGQSGASGKLIAETTNSEGIYSKGDVTICGADVSVTSTTSYAVCANPGNITITNSKVTVNGGMDGFVATNVSNHTDKGNITINGSQVTAIGSDLPNNYGINAVGGDITIGWKNTTDFIKASCYFIEGSGNVKTADGKPFIAYIPAVGDTPEKEAVLIQGNTTLTANAIAAIAGKVLRPATADDVTVSYMDWDDTEKKLVSKNTATDNNADNDIVYVLQGGGATDLPGGWYVAKGEVSYTGRLKFTGDAHLILSDNASMKVTSSSDDAIFGSILTIYSQSIDDDMGSLSANSSSNYSQALNVYDNLTINGGKVTVASKNAYNARGIYNQNVITVNGGVVTATGNGPYVDQGIFTQGSITINGGQVIATSKSDYGIRAYQDVIINGGQVTAIGTSEGHGIEAENITLGWTSTTDFIKASSYKVDNGHAVTADGRRFVAYNMVSEGDISANCIIGSTTGETTLNDTDLGNIAGKTLRPLDGYYVKDYTGLTLSGKTAPDFTISNTPYYIYKANDEVTLTTDKNYGQNGIWFGTFPYDVIADAIVEPGTVVTTKTFAMPAQDFSITDLDYYNTGVKYMDWDDTEKKLVEKTTPDGTRVIVLTGTTGPNTTLTGNWYVVNDWNTTPDADGHSIDVAYNHKLDFSSNVNLILADGCEMTVTGNSSGINVGKALAIYGQSAGTGSLTATGGSSAGIAAYGNVTINGSNITATGSHGIRAWADNTTVTINGGKVTATGGTNGYGIYASSSFDNATIILNLTNGSDFIKASSYYATANNGSASVKTAAGKRFIAYNMASADDISASWFIGDATSNTATTIPDYVSLTDANAARTIAGKTLRPLDGYYVKDEAGLTFSGKTNADGSAKPDFTITTDAGTENEVTTPYYIYKASTEQNPVSVVVSVTGHDDDHMAISTTPDVNQSDDEAFSHCFAMPAQDVTINSIKYYNYGVDYMDWNDTQKKLVSATSPVNTKVWHLDGGGATTLPSGWYVAKGEVTYTGHLQFTGDAHLILADGAEMNATTSDEFIYIIDGSIAIYAQSKGDDMGSLTCFSKNASCIYAESDVASAGITINGGKLILTNVGSANGIMVVSKGFYKCSVTINGGIVTTTGGNYGYGIYANSTNRNASITINGGQVTATGGNEGHGIIVGSKNGTANITLSLTNANDFIKASSYSATDYVTIPAGTLLFVDGTSTVLGNPDAPYVFENALDLDAIAGKTLRVAKNLPVSTGEQYTVVYQEEGDWKVINPNVKMYVPTGNIIKNLNGEYEMELKEVTDGGIPDGMPVILGVENGSLPENIPVAGTSADEADAIEDAYDNTVKDVKKEQGDNLPAITFFGTNTTETLAQQIINAASPKDNQGNVIAGQEVDPKDYFVLGLVGGKLTTLAANQSAVPSSNQPVVVISKFDFLQMIRGMYTALTSNAPSIVIDLGDVTGIETVQGSGFMVNGSDWYTLDGRKLIKQPTTKGVYIRNGVKMVVK